MPSRRPVTKEWLLSSIKKIEGPLETFCWEWQLTKSSSGYGIICRLGHVNKSAHRLSYEMFIGQITNGLWVLHKCDNPLCINPDHLFLGTKDDNDADCKSKGRHSFGTRNGSAKLTEEEIMQIRYKFEVEKQSMLGLAKQFNVSDTHISRIVKGKIWKHLSTGTSLTNETYHRFGRLNSKAKLTEEQVMRIRFKAREGLSIKELVNEFSMSREQIGNIVSGRSWKHLLNKPIWSTPTITEIEA